MAWPSRRSRSSGWSPQAHQAGMDTRQVLARFEAERQALALMDHPISPRSSMAACTDIGRPTSSWNWSRACRSPSTATSKSSLRSGWNCSCRYARRFSTPTRRESSTATSSRSNVLVADYDDKPVPKVIDFGVAKATGGTLTEQRSSPGSARSSARRSTWSPSRPVQQSRRRHPYRRVFPGRAAVRAADRLDAVCGSSLQEAASEMLRVMREEEPPRPSTRLSTADALPTLSANRGTEPKKLTGSRRARLDRDEGAWRRIATAGTRRPTASRRRPASLERRAGRGLSAFGRLPLSQVHPSQSSRRPGCSVIATAIMLGLTFRRSASFRRVARPSADREANSANTEAAKALVAQGQAEAASSRRTKP